MENLINDKAKPHDETLSQLISPKREPTPKSDCGSPESSCVICLGSLENKSFTDSCFHQFCFSCLLEWSKVKPECPLCKQAFKSIIHNVRSIEDYDQYHVHPQEAQTAWESPEGRRFRYRSTLTSERRRELALERLLLGHVQETTRLYNQFRNRPRHAGATSETRQNIYDQNMWALPIEQMPSRPTRMRDVSASFFSANPACTHRLVPWLNRELVVLLGNHEGQIQFVLDLMVSLIQRYDITSPEFREHIHSYIGRRTDHFIHEFYNFARSPWEMAGYDNHVEYQNTSTGRHLQQDNDVIIISPSETVAPVSVVENESHNSLATSVIANHPNISSFGNEGFQGHSSNSNLSGSYNQDHENNTLQNVKKFLSCVSQATNSAWDSPATVTQSSAWDSPVLTTTSATVDVSNILLPPSPQPGPSGISYPANISESSDSSSASPPIRRRCVVNHLNSLPQANALEDDCFVVGYVKPIKERTPPLIDLVSDSESECKDECLNDRQLYNALSDSHRSTCSSSSSTSRHSKSKVRPHSQSSSYHSLSSVVHHAPTSDKRKSSSQRWRWTAYENGGGKLQRTRSSSTDSSYTKLQSRHAWEHKSPHRLRSHHKKHKKHKHKHKHYSREDKQQNHKKHHKDHK